MKRNTVSSRKTLSGFCKVCNVKYSSIRIHYRHHPKHKPLSKTIGGQIEEDFVEEKEEDNDNGNLMMDERNDSFSGNIDEVDIDVGINDIIYGPELPPQLIPQPLKYNGKIPSYIMQYHLRNPSLHQSNDTIEGILNPKERSQYFVRKQQAMLKEIFFIDDIDTALRSGDLEDFINAVKAGAKTRITTLQEEFEQVIHAYMDCVS